MATATKAKTTTAAVKSGMAQFKDDDISAQLEALKSDISTIAERLGHIGETGVQKATHKGEKLTADGMKKTEDLLDDLYDQLQSIEKQAGQTVRRKPLQSLGLAAFAGFAAALIMRR